MRERPVLRRGGGLGQGRRRREGRRGARSLHRAFGRSLHQSDCQGFEAKYGIPVQVLEARASELRERIRTEQSAGRYLGDVMFNSENQAIILSAEDKSIVPHEPVPNSARW